MGDSSHPKSERQDDTAVPASPDSKPASPNLHNPKADQKMAASEDPVVNPSGSLLSTLFFCALGIGLLIVVLHNVEPFSKWMWSLATQVSGAKKEVADAADKGQQSGQAVLDAFARGQPDQALRGVEQAKRDNEAFNGNRSTSRKETGTR